MTHQGSCHCGQVRFEVQGDITSALSCNCSICQRKGALLWFVPRSALHLLTPEDNAKTYLFNRHTIKHRFCPNCGIHPYGEAASPSGEIMAAINLRCVEGIDLQTVPITHFDGRAL
ncbi:MAG: aldehyde-activating protein [Burkholderiales bacterium PBB5]|nr:MAG: aldehyde-activating protein [Burkholderiales bacterium PBB5]